MVTEPYGGRLVDRFVIDNRQKRLVSESHELVGIMPEDSVIYDTEKIANAMRISRSVKPSPFFVFFPYIALVSLIDLLVLRHKTV